MLKINREELLQQLESVVPGLSVKEIIEQSKCFVFKDKKVMTYNDEVACTQDSCLDIEGAVEAMPLISLLRKLKEEEIDLHYVYGTTSGKGKETIVVFSSDNNDKAVEILKYILSLNDWAR